MLPGMISALAIFGAGLIGASLDGVKVEFGAKIKFLGLPYVMSVVLVVKIGAFHPFSCISLIETIATLKLGLLSSFQFLKTHRS